MSTLEGFTSLPVLETTQILGVSFTFIRGDNVQQRESESPQQEQTTIKHLTGALTLPYTF